MGDTGTDETATDRTTTESDAERVLVLNPVSGTGDHVAEVRSRTSNPWSAARDRGPRD
jgi:hypothetical protein